MDGDNLHLKNSRSFDDILYAYGLIKQLDLKIEKEIESNEDSISRNAIELAVLIKKILKIVEDHLLWEYHAEAKSLGNQKEDIGLINRNKQRIDCASQVIASMSHLLKYIYGANVQTNNWSVTTYMDNFCRSLFPDSRIIIRPRWEYNYSFISINEELIRITESISHIDLGLYRAIINLLKKSPKYFSLAYPPSANNNILQMVLWGHEIAHLLDYQQLITDTNVDKKIILNNSAISDGIYSFSTLLLDDYLERNEQKIDLDLYNRLLNCLGLSENDPEFKEKYNHYVTEQIALFLKIWAKEIFADLLSVRIMGPAILFAFIEFINPVTMNIDVGSAFYPPLRFRLNLLLEEFNRWEGENPIIDNLNDENIKLAFIEELENIKSVINSPNKKMLIEDVVSPVQDDFVDMPQTDEFSEIFSELLYTTVQDYILFISDEIDLVINEKKVTFLSSYDLSKIIPQITDDLKNDIPPTFSQSEVNREKIFAALLNVGWLYWLSIRRNSRCSNIGNYIEIYKKYEKINSLLQKSLEISEATNWYEARKTKIDANNNTNSLESDFSVIANRLGVLTKTELLKMIGPENRIIFPILNEANQIGSCSIDIRLGNEFVITKNPQLSILDPLKFNRENNHLNHEDTIYVPFGKAFILHPNQFVICNTLEYFSFPYNLLGLVIGRSSWGKLGLTIATPNKISPLFKGNIPLQLTNLGNLPITLYPCSRISQIVLIKI